MAVSLVDFFSLYLEIQSWDECNCSTMMKSLEDIAKVDLVLWKGVEEVLMSLVYGICWRTWSTYVMQCLSLKEKAVPASCVPRLPDLYHPKLQGGRVAPWGLGHEANSKCGCLNNWVRQAYNLVGRGKNSFHRFPGPKPRLFSSTAWSQAKSQYSYLSKGLCSVYLTEYSGRSRWKSSHTLACCLA